MSPSSWVPWSPSEHTFSDCSIPPAPVATPAKVEAEKPVLSRTPKRQRALAESDKDLSCSSPRIQRLQHGGRRLTPQKLAS